MMKKFLRPFTMLLAFTYSGCQESELQAPDTDLVLIGNAKQFFNENVLNSSTNNVNQNNPRASLQKTVRWDDAYVQELSVGEAVVVPVHFESPYYIKSDGGNALSLNGLTKLLIYRDSDQNYRSELVTRLPYRDSRSKSNQEISGLIYVEDWAGNPLKNYLYKDNGETAYVKHASNRDMSSNAYVQVIEICYELIRWNYGPLDPTGYYVVEFLGCNYFYVDDGGSDGASGDDYGDVGGGGSGYNGDAGTNPCAGNGRIPEGDPCADAPDVEPMSIINAVEDPCLRQMVNDYLNRNSFMTYMFKRNQNFDVKFLEQPLGSGIDQEDGNTRKQTGDNGYFKIEIALNSDVLPGSSKQYIMATIIHEVYHAYMILFMEDQSSNDASHIAMSQDEFFEEMVQMLMELSPMDERLARDLTWGGLYQTSAFTNLPVAEQNRIKGVNRDHSRGAHGTPCEG